MSISQFPPAPSRTASADEFEAQVDGFLGHFSAFVSEVNAESAVIVEAKGAAQAAAATASDRATAAGGSATSAAGSATSAANSAAAAQGSATAAGNSANAAAGSATVAGNSAAAAANSASAAQGYAASINPAGVRFTGGTLDGVTIGDKTPGPVTATTVMTTGSVGVGTTSPAESLDVNGAIAIVGKKFFSKIGSESYIWNNTSGLNVVDYVGNVVQVRVDRDGNFLTGVQSGSYHNIQRAAANGGGVLLVGSSTAGALSTLFLAVGGSGYSGTAAAQWIGKDLTTGRSANAGGTINVIGNDYAEYMRKALRHAHWIFQKGDIVGIDASGELTPVFADAVAFAVKSTSPSFVGGDVWGGEDAVGKRPEPPVYVAPEYRGSPNPGEKPVAPTRSLPEKPVQQDGEADDTYAVRVASWQEYCAVAQSEFEQSIAAHTEALAAWEKYFAMWQADDDKYQAQIIAAKFAFESAKSQYEIDLPAFESMLEEARQRVDRIAFCGQVPVNVTGATPGQYVVPVAAADGGIAGVSKNEDDLSLRDYMRAVGKVIAVEADGRAKIIVKVA